MNLTRICRSWRNAALNTRSLWSVWFIEMGAPSKKALSMLKGFLKQFIRRSGDFTLKFHIRFTGKFDIVEACNAVEPLLDHQDRWEEAECRFEGNEGDVSPGLTLDLSKLLSLQNLRVNGSVWDCDGYDPAILQPKSPLSDTYLKLSSLRTVELVGLPSLAYYTILSASPTITELKIDVWDRFSVPTGRVVVLPTLRKLDVHNSFPILEDDGRRLSLLHLRECKALEEFSIHCLPRPHPFVLSHFLDRNELDDKLLSVRLQFLDGCPPSNIHDEAIITILLRRLSSLRSLTLHGALTRFTVLMFGSDGDLLPIMCPLLEEVVFEKITAEDAMYTEAINARWNAPTRCIKSWSFVDCNVVRLSQPDETRRLTYIDGVDACIKGGLKLAIRNTTDTSTSTVTA